MPDLRVSDVVCNYLSGYFNNHHRRFPKTALHSHCLTIVPQHYRHIHTGQLPYRETKYPGARDLQTRLSCTGCCQNPIRFQALDVYVWSADRHQPTSSPRMQSNVGPMCCCSSASHGGNNSCFRSRQATRWHWLVFRAQNYD